MATLAELKTQLAEAEAQEKAETAARELSDAKARFEGRCFAWGFTMPSSFGVVAVQVAEIYPTKWAHREDLGNVRYRGTKVTAFTEPSERRRTKMGGMQLTITEAGGEYENLDHMNWTPANEANSQVYRALYNLAKARINSFLTTDVVKLCDALKNWVPRALEHSSDADLEAPTDVQYIQLKDCDVDLVPRQYVLNGTRFLVTAESRRLGLQKIAARRRQLDSGNGLYESCDMPYVNSSHRRLTELETQLTR